MRKVPFLFFPLLWLSLVFAQAQDDKQITEKTFSKEKLEKHIRFIASDELMGRDTPSEGQEKAAQYLIDQLKAFGVQPLPEYPDYRQPVSMKTQKKPVQINLSYNGQNFVVKDNLVLLEGNSAQIDAPAVYLGFGTEADFANADVAGKIVFVNCGVEGEASPQQWFYAGRTKRKLATDKGAVALVEMYNNPQLPWIYLVGYLHTDRTGLDNSATNTTNIPHLWMGDSGDTQATAWKAQPNGQATLNIVAGEQKKFDVFNVVGMVKGIDPELSKQIVAYTAHYDHVGIGRPDEKGDSIYNGARDNAIGTTTVLSLAENMVQFPAKRSGLFVFFTGEEKGLLGSTWFVDHCPIPLNQIVYCFNSDNAGYNSTAVSMIMGLFRTTADVYIQKACEAFGLKAIDDPAPEQNLFDRSDNVSFAKKGIPAPTYSLGLTAFDAEIDKFYHQPADQPDNLDYDYLYKFGGAYIYAARMIANADQAPFWKEGDKYYEAGVKLYNK